MAQRVSQTGIIVEYTVDDHAIRASQTGVIIEYEPQPGWQVSQAGVETAWIPQPPREISVSQAGIEIGQQPEYTDVLVSQAGIDVAWIPFVDTTGEIYIYLTHLGTTILEDGIYSFGCRLDTQYDYSGSAIYQYGVDWEH